MKACCHADGVVYSPFFCHRYYAEKPKGCCEYFKSTVCSTPDLYRMILPLPILTNLAFMVFEIIHGSRESVRFRK